MADSRLAEDVAWLDRTHAPAEEREDSLQRRLDVSPGQVVLEIGPGTGADLQILAASAGSEGLAIGVEKWEAMAGEAVRRARDVPCVALVVGDATRLPVRNDAVDACLGERVLQHVGDIGAAVAELARVLRSGGRVALTEPDQTVRTIDHPLADVERRIREHTALTYAQPTAGRQLRRRLIDAGLRVDTVEPLMVASTEAAFGSVEPAAKAAEAGAITFDERDQYGAILADLISTDRFLSTWTAYSVTATKPGS